MTYTPRAVLASRPETSDPALIDACRRGHEPAELLTTSEREHLIFDLWAAGWTDLEIATHCRMTTFTTARIRARLGLAAHPSTKGAVA